MKRDVEIKLLKIKNERKTDIERRCKKKWLEIVNKEDVTNNFGSTTKVHKFNIYIYIYFFFFIINRISLSRIRTDIRTPFRYISQYS